MGNEQSNDKPTTKANDQQETKKNGIVSTAMKNVVIAGVSTVTNDAVSKDDLSELYDIGANKINQYQIKRQKLQSDNDPDYQQKITTWNSQGKKCSDVAGYIKRQKPAVFCIQEAGKWLPSMRWSEPFSLDNVPNSWGKCYYGDCNFGTQKSPLLYSIAYWTNDDKAGSQKMVCLVHKDAVAETTPLITFQNSKLRPIIGLSTTISIKKADNINVYSLHAPSGNANTAAGVSNTLIRIMSRQAPNTNFFVAGDYNCQPIELKDNRYWDGGNHVVASGKCTRRNTTTKSRDKEYDYAVTNFDSGILLASIGVGTAGLDDSDHRSVEFSFK